MTDKELLELAANAIGIRLEWDWDPAKWKPEYYEGKTYHSWNPLNDDALALRLAVKLKIGIDYGLYDGEVLVRAGRLLKTPCFEDINDDPYAATRRAIVRAAAEIGRTL